jgi:hypothetical protein
MAIANGVAAATNKRGSPMNLTRLIDIKERIAISDEWKPEERDFILGCINEAVEARRPAAAVLHAPPNYLGRIDRIWAFLSLDDGGEGLVAAPLDGMTVPLIAADKRRLDALIPIAKQMTKLFRKPIRLAKFSKRDDVEIYQPEQS